MWPRATEQGEETKKWLTTYQFNHSLSYICTRTHTRTHAHTHTHTHKVHAHARTHTYTHSHSQVDTITSIHTIITQFTVLHPVNAVQAGRRHTKLNPSLGPEADQNQAESQLSQVKPVTLSIASLILELYWTYRKQRMMTCLQLWEGLCVYNYTITARQLYDNAEVRVQLGGTTN